MDETLRKLQLTQLEILRVIDSLCKKESIAYSLYAGTLLGAVRHQGFIPWDDDLDICMTRSEYERFLRAWDRDPPEGYILQNKDNTPSYTQSFSKIRKEHTTFLQYEWEAGRYHTGIFIDIFPIDRFPETLFESKMFYFRSILFQLFTREFVPPKANLLIQSIARFILWAVDNEKRAEYRRKLFQKLVFFDQQPTLKMICFHSLDALKRTFPSEMMDDYVDLIFEGYAFPCTSEWDTMLNILFGDYMTLPPEEERTWRHHPILLDFEHDYRELSGRP